MSAQQPSQRIVLQRAVDKSGEVIRGVNREAQVLRLAKFAEALPLDRGWQFEVSEARRRRSLEQNAYLWGCVYPTILAAGGEQLRGWSADDLHEYLLGEVFGWETIEGFGRKRLRPIRRSSRMTTVEFADYIDQVQTRMALIGIYIPDPMERR